ncbi:hypothetical protein NQD34_008168, partial [Periophthalmus magnuspinnatus]
VAEGRAARLRGAAGRRQDLGLELKQLTHEAEVWGDDAAPLFDKLEGLVQPHAVGPHQVRQADGRGAGDPGLTVHKHTSSLISDRV